MERNKAGFNKFALRRRLSLGDRQPSLPAVRLVGCQVDRQSSCLDRSSRVALNFFEAKYGR